MLGVVPEACQSLETKELAAGSFSKLFSPYATSRTKRRMLQTVPDSLDQQVWRPSPVANMRGYPGQEIWMLPSNIAAQSRACQPCSGSCAFHTGRECRGTQDNFGMLPPAYVLG